MNTPDSYFEGQYARADDPWRLAERWYDRRKYELTVAALPRARYRAAFEPGCSVGVLSALLAPRCDALLCADRAPRAVEAASRRLARMPQVTVRHMSVPGQWPAGSFDLVVLSELLYYFGSADRARVLRHSIDSLGDGGHLVTVHWNHPVDEHTRTGREIAEEVEAAAELRPLARYDDPDFTLTVHERATGPGAALSPARAEGLA
ncbi:SAM-dependent methyltransferase [Streptomyces sp. NPDC101181]|uniref:SAM-dependent methyltransferase n=1 Tax=Streptomyces sp. NPDC101181 TaxID=3366125 RepID=UPI00381D2B3B